MKTMLTKGLIHGLISVFTVAALSVNALDAQAATAPAEIKIGTLYASSGNFAAISMPTYSGLKFWVDQKNAEGGVFVKPFNKKIPIKLVAYDDQSNTATAATLYNQLITQDKVDLLVADSGSVLTSVGVPIARDHKMLLVDQTGTGASFFTKDNPYIVLTANPVSSIWPKYAADFITKQGPALGIKRVAILYATNDFTGTQANAVRGFIKNSGAPIEIVYDQGVPTTTTNYSVLINNIKATNPDAVVELGYTNNDISFLRNLQDSGVKFNFVFNIYAGLETEHLLATAGPKAMEYSYTYVTASNLHYKPEFGMTLDDYHAAWEKKNSDGKVEFGFNAVAGYLTGLVLESGLAKTDSLDQLAMRKAIGDLSGKLKTLDGTFQLDETGAQVGEITPLGQLLPDGHGSVKFTVVYPPEMATGKAVYPTPQ
jgi:branched-chain amino acid transport system substrate-binding protein